MPAKFQAVFTAFGVDEDAKPWPAMVVPTIGSNVVALAGGDGLRLEMPNTLKYDELHPGAVGPLPEFFTPFGLLMLKPQIGIFGRRYFRIASRFKTPATAQVKAFGAGRSKPDAELHVSVLAPRSVKLAIRPVVSGPSDRPTYHSRQPFDVKDMCGHMNFVWTPQANVVFELVGSDDAPITDGAEIAKILDVKTEVPLPRMVVIERFRDVFVRLRDQNKKRADLTMFLVEGAADSLGPGVLYSHAHRVKGVTDPTLGISLISDDRASDTNVMAHEAGHFLGSTRGPNGKWIIYGHQGGTSDLMQEGGSDVGRIPFKEAIYFNRTTNP